MANSVIAPAVLMRPIRSPAISVNHKAPSGPGAIPPGLPPEGSANSAGLPPGVKRPILLLLTSVNQRFPSGPAVMLNGFEFGLVVENSSIGLAKRRSPLLTTYRPPSFARTGCANQLSAQQKEPAPEGAGSA